MIVVDACVLISHLGPGDAHRANAASLLDTEEELVVHPLSVSEAAVGAVKIRQLSLFQRSIERLGIDVWQPDAEHYYRIAALRASTSLKLPDCCVLDCARTLSATLASFDAHLAGVARSLGVVVDSGADSA